MLAALDGSPLVPVPGLRGQAGRDGDVLETRAPDQAGSTLGEGNRRRRIAAQHRLFRHQSQPSGCVGRLSRTGRSPPPRACLQAISSKSAGSSAGNPQWCWRPARVLRVRPGSRPPPFRHGPESQAVSRRRLRREGQRAMLRRAARDRVRRTDQGTVRRDISGLIKGLKVSARPVSAFAFGRSARATTSCRHPSIN